MRSFGIFHLNWGGWATLSFEGFLLKTICFDTCLAYKKLEQKLKLLGECVYTSSITNYFFTLCSFNLHCIVPILPLYLMHLGFWLGMPV